MKFRKLKYILYGLILLFLFHFESLSLGPVKISHLWKGALLLFLIIAFFRNKNFIHKIYKPLLWISVLQLLNPEIFYNPFNSILNFGTTLILPMLGLYVMKFTSKQIKDGLLFFSTFFILSFLPYKLGLLTSIKSGYDLSSFSSSLEQGGIIGPFQTVHSASTALAGAILTAIYFWFNRSFNRLFLSLIIVLGFYFLINTFVRTGMLMVVIGVLPMVFYYSKKNALTRIQLILISGLFGILISSWVLTNETLLNRIKGESKYNSEFDSLERLGSGRGKLYITSLVIFEEAHTIEKIIGSGLTQVTSRMNKKIGYSILPHNGFLTLLLINGIFGLFVFIYFLRNIYTFHKTLQTKNKILIKVFLGSYLIMTFFQNYDMLYMYLILVLGIAYTFKEKQKLKTI